MLNPQISKVMSDSKSKKSVWTILLTVAKYAIALVLGYLTGDGDVINLI